MKMSKLVVVLDLNDTVTLLNAIDADKSIDVVLNQLVAQNVYVNNGQTIEGYIKTNIVIKQDQRKTYGNLLLYSEQLLDMNIISSEEYNKIPSLHKIYSERWEKTLINKGGFFDSCFKLIDYLLDTHPNVCIQVQSFGGEIPKFFDQMKKSYPNLPMQCDILDFEQCNSISEILKNVEKKSIPGYLTACKNDYNLWVHESFGKPIIFDSNITTIFFDDNAYRCATIIEKDDNEYRIVHSQDKYRENIIKVDTASALLNENYFVNIVKDII